MLLSMNIFDLPELPLTKELTTILAESGSTRNISGSGGSARNISGSGGSACNISNGSSSGNNSSNSGSSVRIERIVSTGQVTGWYDQPETEFVALLEGNAVIEYEGGKRISMNRGDTLIIKPHERHKVAFTSSDPPCIWLCVFY